MNEQELISEIISRFPEYKSQETLLLEKVSNLSPDLKQSLETFIGQGISSSISYEGYTLQKLEIEHGMNPIAAHFTLDWLRRNPDEAKTSLQKGHDLVKNIAKMKNELETIEDFQNKLEDILAGELKVWAKRFNKEKMIAFDFGCFPWDGEISLNFCTEEERNIIEDVAAWKLFMFNTHYTGGDWTGKYQLQKWMKTMYDSRKYTSNDFFKVCANAIKSEKVQNSLKLYNLSENFRITLIDSDSKRNWIERTVPQSTSLTKPNLLSTFQNAVSMPDIKDTDSYEILLQTLGKTLHEAVQGLAKDNWENVSFYAQFGDGVNEYKSLYKVKGDMPEHKFLIRNSPPISKAIKKWLETSKKGTLKSFTYTLQNDGKFNLEVEW